MLKTLEIIFESDELVAINKPHGLLVHRTKMAREATEFALQMLRDQLGHHVYPCHRLDRKTSGVLLFAKNADTNRQVQQLFQERRVSKTYLAIVRGYTSEAATIDYALRNDDKVQGATTHYKKLQQFEIELPHRHHPTSRYSLLEVQPHTGRFHQIRKHMAHIRHPILGDRPHGCNKQNKLWKEHFGLNHMMLHASQLEFDLEHVGRIVLEARLSDVFKDVLSMLSSENITSNN